MTTFINLKSNYNKFILLKIISKKKIMKYNNDARNYPGKLIHCYNTIIRIMQYPIY